MPSTSGRLGGPLAFALVPFTASAQSVTAQQPNPPFIYATYFQCDPAREERADALVREALAPILDQQMAGKGLIAWGWMAHNTGGPWRRVSYVAAPDQLFHLLL